MLQPELMDSGQGQGLLSDSLVYSITPCLDGLFSILDSDRILLLNLSKWREGPTSAMLDWR